MILPITIIRSYFWKWKPFWRKLQELGDAISDEGEFYRQLRRETTGGFVLIFLVSGRCLTIDMFDLMPKETGGDLFNNTPSVNVAGKKR